MPLRSAAETRPAAAVLICALGALTLASCSQSADARPGRAVGAGADLNGPATGKFTAPEYVMGSAKAPVTVVEYLSDTCSHCAAFDAEVFPTIKAKYIDTGKVRWTIREMLTDPQAVSAAGFVLARCAGRDKYWPVIEAIFRSQADMFKTGDVHGTFLKIAQSVGMNEKQFDACVQDDAAFKALSARIDATVKAGIGGTPTILINGKIYTGIVNDKKYDAPLDTAGLEKALTEAATPRAKT